MLDNKMDDRTVLGEDRGLGNMLAIQPWMSLGDYASETAFYDRLASYLETARTRGWLNERSLAVFPEYIGTWLVAAGEGKGVFQAAALQPAMRGLALAHPFSLLRNLTSAGEKDRLAASLFRVKAQGMAECYTRAFSRLARTFQLTIVAGTILLPGASVKDGQVQAGRGALENVSAVFGPDGRAHPVLARKCFPIQDELPFLTPARVENLPVYDTPAGRLGVLVCADSWYPSGYAALRARGIQLLAVPSYINHTGAWDQTWCGYSGWPAPADVEPADVGSLTEGQAWRKYALSGRITASGARCGVNVFFQGSLWDMGSDGRSLLIRDGIVREAATRGAALLNLWI